MTWSRSCSTRFGQLEVLGAKRLRETGNAFGGCCVCLLAEKIGDCIVLLWQRGDAPADRVEFDPFLGHLGDVGVRFQELEPFLDWRGSGAH
jgi:hypothetical protein